jgi:hypothetical protein
MHGRLQQLAGYEQNRNRKRQRPARAIESVAEEASCRGGAGLIKAGSRGGRRSSSCMMACPWVGPA